MYEPKIQQLSRYGKLDHEGTLRTHKTANFMEYIRVTHPKHGRNWIKT